MHTTTISSVIQISQLSVVPFLSPLLTLDLSHLILGNKFLYTCILFFFQLDELGELDRITHWRITRSIQLQPHIITEPRIMKTLTVNKGNHCAM